MTGTIEAVAKKKTGPKPSPTGPRGSLITVKCHDDFKDWLVAFSKASLRTPSQMIEYALIELAKAQGFRKPPER